MINLPICAAAIVLAVRYVPPTTAQPRKRIDLVGVALLGIGVAALLFGLSNTAADRSPVIVWSWLPLAGGALLTIGFVAWSMIKSDPAVPVRLLGDRSFGAATATLFVTGVALYGALFLIPLYFQQQRGLTAVTAGALLALQGLGSLLTRWVGGVVDRIGARLISVVGVIGCAIATVPFAIGTTDWILLGAALIVRGGCLSAVNIAITSGAFTDLSRDQVPAGSAIIRLVQQLGGAAGTALLATLATAFAPHGFQLAFAASIVLTLLALIPSIRFPAHHREPVPVEPSRVG